MNIIKYLFNKTIPIFKHNKRESLYIPLGKASLQTAPNRILRDGDELNVYVGEDGKLWVRPVDEFNDGRFSEVGKIKILDEFFDETSENLPNMIEYADSENYSEQTLVNIFTDFIDINKDDLPKPVDEDSLVRDFVLSKISSLIASRSIRSIPNITKMYKLFRERDVSDEETSLIAAARDMMRNDRDEQEFVKLKAGLKVFWDLFIEFDKQREEKKEVVNV